MYNIIIFFILVACILVFLFINSQKIVEGAKNKGKSSSKTASAAAAAYLAETYAKIADVSAKKAAAALQSGAAPRSVATALGSSRAKHRQ